MRRAQLDAAQLAAEPAPAARQRLDIARMWPRAMPAAGALGAGAAVLVFLVLTLPHLRWFPVWDGYAYLGCVREKQFDCALHSSQAYTGTMWIAWVLGRHQVAALNLVNAALGSVAVLAFWRALAVMYPDRSKLEVALAAACVASAPVIAASALQLSIDFGVYVGFMLLLAALPARNRVMAIVAGLVMSFSKETGLAVYVATCGVFVLLYRMAPAETFRAAVREIVLHLHLLAVPVAFAGYLGWRLFTHQPLTFANNSPELSTSGAGGSPLDFNPLNFTEPIVASFLAAIFLVNFGWVALLVSGAGYASRLTHLALERSHARKLLPLSKPAARTAFCVALLLVCTYVVTRYRLWTNPRYFITVLPLIALVMFDAVGWLSTRALVRATALAGYLALLLLSTYHTADPLSKRVFGTFAFGDHAMLRMTSISHECCGLGRDQLAYNLEYLEFGTLSDKLLAGEHPRPPAAIVLAGPPDWNRLIPGVNAKTWSRGFPESGGDPIQVTSSYEVGVNGLRPPTIYYVEFPNLANSTDIATLHELGYRDVRTHWYRNEGFAARVVTMKLG